MDDAGFKAKYGPWAVIAGGSEGTGRSFARLVAARGLNCVLVAKGGPPEQTAREIRDEFGVETGHLSADGSHPIMAKPGLRPRHMALHPNKILLYCNGETSANIAGYTVGETTGALTQFQGIDAWPVDSSLPTPSTGAVVMLLASSVLPLPVALPIETPSNFEPSEPAANVSPACPSALMPTIGALPEV